jgi:hypothetical protein
MRAHIFTTTVFMLGAAFAFGTPAGKAADLAQSGTIKTHGAHKGTVQSVQVGEKHSMGTGSFGVLRTTSLAVAPSTWAPRCAHSRSMM